MTPSPTTPDTGNNNSSNSSSAITKIVYPTNLINDSATRYGNQFMALYINGSPDSGTTFSGASRKPQIKDVNGNPVNYSNAPGHSGSVLNNFNLTNGGNIRINQGTNTLYAIYLPIPSNLATSFNMTYEEFAFGTKGADAISGVVSGAGNAAISRYTKGAAAEGNSVGAIAGVGAQKLINGVGDIAAATVQVTTEKTINPHQQLLFKGVGFRKFSFEYSLVARNKTEADTLDYIIRLLRFYMHPGLALASLLYSYPNEFDIEFWILDKGVASHNKYLPFYSTSILESMSVSYSDSKEFSSHADGSPVTYKLTLSFKESQILNKTVINAFDTYVNNGGIQIQ